jgi:hypothetical protein
MQAHACPNCGAPLPIAAPGTVEHCAYCGSETLEAPGPQATVSAAPRDEPASVPPSAEPETAIARRRAWAVAVAWTAILAGFAVALYGGAVVVDSCKHVSTPGLTRASLATTPLDHWQALDAPGMVGRYEAFDAIANLDWARSIGTSWKADAILTVVRIARVAKDGTVNLAITPDAEVRYDFVSPKCIASYRAGTSLVATKNACRLMVVLHAQLGRPGIDVMTVSAATEERYDEVEGLTCTMGQAFGVLEKSGNLPPRPVYDATLQGSSGGRLTWSFRLIVAGQTIHAIDAKTCAVAW